jgi:enamine deaminase RidA (YjgF/YER057c/UK114 family)
MGNSIDERLKELGVRIPAAPAPVANYVGYVHHGDLVFVSGQLPFMNGSLTHTGILGEDVTVEEGAVAARICAINVLSQLSAALKGDLDRVTRCVRLGGFVASKADFFDHPKVVNGASDFIGEVFGIKGAHARAAVGVAALPMNACVEIDAIFGAR